MVKNCAMEENAVSPFVIAMPSFDDLPVGEEDDTDRLKIEMLGYMRCLKQQYWLGKRKHIWVPSLRRLDYLSVRLTLLASLLHILDGFGSVVSCFQKSIDQS
ncbi:hypothetical protein ECG_03421 [Echinococcus granulosus]|nr:hypothetical protein ECG_03421 [Echinococcus granulosus]